MREPGLRFYTVASALRPETERYARKVYEELSKALKAYGVEGGGLILSPEDVPARGEFAIVAVATGGTETAILKLYESGSRPLILVATGLANSLAAALEAAAALKAREKPYGWSTSKTGTPWTLARSWKELRSTHGFTR